MAFLLITIILFVFSLCLLFHYILPTVQRYRQLLKEFQNITFLSLSKIPLIGNLHHFDKRPYMLFRLVCRLAKQAQDQNKGLFCLWIGIRPRLFLCSGQGLEVDFTSNYIHFYIYYFSSF